jgi:hypothetical protein
MLYHIHYYTPDWIEAEARFCREFGFSVFARYGTQGERWGPEVGLAEITATGARVRLTDLAAGAVNLVLGPAAPNRRPVMEHLGVTLPRAEVERAVQRAARLGWPVTERTERRLFVHTPYGFRVELVPREAWRERWTGDSWSATLAEVRLSAQAPAEAATALACLLHGEACGGEVTGPGLHLSFVDQPGRAGVLIGYRLTHLPSGEREDPCGALVWGGNEGAPAG